jgi:hypothetical protein
MTDIKKLNFLKDQMVVTRIWAKKDFQKILKSFRDNGLSVEKINSGYIVYKVSSEGSHTLMCKAMNGSNGYLVRCDSSLF